MSHSIYVKKHQDVGQQFCCLCQNEDLLRAREFYVDVKKRRYAVRVANV